MRVRAKKRVDSGKIVDRDMREIGDAGYECISRRDELETRSSLQEMTHLSMDMHLPACPRLKIFFQNLLGKGPGDAGDAGDEAGDAGDAGDESVCEGDGLQVSGSSGKIDHLLMDAHPSISACISAIPDLLDV